MIGLIPVLIFGGIYLYYDPFKVLYEYDSFYDSASKDVVNLNRDFLSTSTFIKNNPDEQYDSFILGSSRSIFYEVADWKPHLSPDAKCFHFDASGESLWALHKKVLFIDEQGNEIDNILLILDFDTLIQDQPKSGHLGVISPALVDNNNQFEFHKEFFTAFLNPKFLYAFMDYKITDEIKPYMRKGNLLDDRKRNYDPLTNEIRFEHYEELIEKGEYYTPERLAVFYDRDSKQTYLKPSIKENQKRMLNEIAAIVEKQNTKLRIVISPAYDQKKFNPEDLAFLNETFGTDSVFDFSGINEITQDYRNYYESAHYRPHVAKQIMDSIYKK
ncbi:hypothetical protein POW22_04700 [Gilvibacter sediminis]|nr:hypothetical protein [Gilvibacter sediminis]